MNMIWTERGKRGKETPFLMFKIYICFVKAASILLGWTSEPQFIQAALVTTKLNILYE